MSATKDRSREILHSIVRSYIQTGQPVASGRISRRERQPVSPATIRSVMAGLTEAGYLTQPHTSAGRVPTEKAYRSFVASLEAKLLARELVRIRERLLTAESLEGRFQSCSRMLTEMTRGVGIVVAIPATRQVLEQVDLVAIEERRVLIVLITRERLVRNRVVTIEEPVTQDELNRVRNYINRNFRGWALADVRHELKRRLEEAHSAYDEVLRKLMLLWRKGFLEAGLAPEVHMEGASNLVAFDFHLTRDRLRDLFRTLEEDRRVLELLERFLEVSSGAMSIQIGLGEMHPSLCELSLIGTSVTLPGGLSAKLAVLGPTRMDYQRALSAVRHLGEAFQSLPA